MKQLIPYFVQKKLEQQTLHGQLSAYVLFIDLSGFTPLTETLMDQGSRGAEALTNILNKIFQPLVEMVYERGGFIPYFAGDAFTAIFPDDGQVSASDVLDTALAIREHFLQRQFRFGGFWIGLKIGLSHGEVEWGILGRNYRSYYFRGQPIDASALCQAKAKNQDYSIVLDTPMELALKGREVKLVTIEPGYFFVPNTLDQVAASNFKPLNTILRREIVEQFLPNSIVDYTQDGEFRTVVSVFISFDGVDNHRLLNRFVSVVLEQINNFSGYFKEVDFGDKGGVLVGFFGAPISFENLAERALEFIFTLRQDLLEMQEKYKFRYRVGATLGTAYTGIVGGEERCQYAAVGNRVNLAARLMTYAKWGEVLVDAELRKNHHFRFQHRGDIKYKGIQGNVPTFKLVGKNEASYSAYSGVMVGRDEETQQLIQFSEPLFIDKPTGVAYIFGEAGIGKSRLTFELRKALTGTDKVQWFQCQADQILKKPFNPFIYFLRTYFEQSPEETPERNLQNFEARYEQLLLTLSNMNGQDARLLRSELVRTKSVLAALIGIVYFDSLWEQLDAKGRYQNTILAIINLFLSESMVRSVVIELEDGHWLDENSLELIQELVRQIKKYPIFLLITSRYRDDGSKPVFFDKSLLDSYKIPQLEIDMNMLKPEAVREFAEFKLQGSISEDFFEMLLRTTNSNPFYLEQLLEYFNEQKLLRKKDGKWIVKDKNIELSSSINAILTARIDRLSGLVKETVKAAAVIGREFEVPVLTEVMKANAAFLQENGKAGELLAEQIHVAEQGQIWRAMNELRYIFKHSLLREAAYSMQLRTRLQQLHRLIAEAIERLYHDKLEERYVDLAFHYEMADVQTKTREYLKKAADYARSNFQNQQALDFYEKLLHKLNTQVDLPKQIQTYLQKGRVLEMIGDWDECEKTYEQALELAKQDRDVLLLGHAHNHLGHVLLLKGTYQDATRYLQTAEQLFESIDDKNGIAEVKGNLGNLFFRQGRYEEAKTYFQDSLRIGRTIPNKPVDANIVANLGLTFMNQGLFDEGIKTQIEQLNVCKRNNDKQGMASIYTYMGIVYLEKGEYEQALNSFNSGLELSQELGNKHLTSIAIGNIGIVYERQGDYDRAMENYILDLKICEELGDKQGISIALGLIGQLLNIQGEFYKAIEYLQKTLMMSEELGYQKGIAKAVNTLGDIFFYLGEYERSLHFYDKAIEVTRNIGNKLVLGFSLVEKGLVLIETRQETALEQTVKDALAVAEELGNPDLSFEALLLSKKMLIFKGQVNKAKKELHQLLKKELDTDQQAPIYFELSKIEPEKPEIREKALQLYQTLYEATPRFTYKERIDRLQ